MAQSEALLVGDKLIEFLALAIAGVTGGSVGGGPTRRQLYMRAVDHISRNLKDPDLDPAAVAAAVGISQRSLYSIFGEEGKRVADFIIGERLDRAHYELGSTVGADRSVTDVAMGWGFKSSSHFSRRFVARFGSTPSEVRSRARKARF